MDIVINGETESSEPCSITELVARKQLSPGALVVELNQKIIKQEQWHTIQLKENDRLELLSFVGGG